MKKLLVRYFSNNSGGNDWLDETAWKKLEDAGWRLYGFGNFEYADGNEVMDETGRPKFIGELDRSKYAYKRFDDIKTALKEFEELTGADVTAEGCNCCGAPHEFSWEGPDGRDSCSGEDAGTYLLGVDLTKSKREMLGL